MTAEELREEIEYYTLLFLRCKDDEQAAVIARHIERLENKLKELEEEDE